MPELLRDLKKHFGYLENDRLHWENGAWRDIVENLFPYRENLKGTMPKGSRKATKIYNSAPMIYLNIFAEGIHGNMINNATVWFILRLPANYRVLEEIPEVRQWLQDTQEILYYFLAESNFYSVMRQYFKDGGSLGTAYLTVEEDFGNDKLVFYCLHTRECYIAENQFGRVDTMFRKFPLTARSIKQKFGEDNLTDKIKQSLKNNPYTEHDIIHCVYPNDEFNKTKIGTKYKKWASKYFVAGASDNDKFLREKGYDDFPYMVWRYFKGDKAPYGDSPATFALPEIMKLQVISKSLLRAGAIASDPAHNIPSEMEGSVDTGPGGASYYGPDFNRKITPITSGINFPIGQDREDKIEEILKRHFHVNYFLAIEQTKRQMTAKEVIERKSEAMILSASVGDLSIMLDSVIDYIFNLKTTAGQIPPPPDVLIQHMAGKRIPVEYMGPLAQEAKRLFETRGIMDSLEAVAPLLEIWPEIADIFNKDKTAKKVSDSFGFPSECYNPPTTIKQIREGRALQQDEEMKKIDMERLADTLKALAQAHKNSPELLEQIQGVLAEVGGGQQGIGVPTI